MKIIGTQGEGRFLIGTKLGSQMVIVADLTDGFRFKPIEISRLMKQGSWDDYEHDEELMQRLLKLPQLGS